MMNDETGFANGEKFLSACDVREYFTVDNMLEMFGSDYPRYYGRDKNEDITADVLRDYADYVIENKLHCDF